mmetsp:Transcript_46757/g.109058  ORF Transcript_46757/g.109058 Transcript_46757/m.109058 type:complete len:265 (+) Transcript_46757:92-886(+)
MARLAARACCRLTMFGVALVVVVTSPGAFTGPPHAQMESKSMWRLATPDERAAAWQSVGDHFEKNSVRKLIDRFGPGRLKVQQSSFLAAIGGLQGNLEIDYVTYEAVKREQVLVWLASLGDYFYIHGSNWSAEPDELVRLVVEVTLSRGKLQDKLKQLQRDAEYLETIVKEPQVHVVLLDEDDGEFSKIKRNLQLPGPAVAVATVVAWSGAWTARRLYLIEKAEKEKEKRRMMAKADADMMSLKKELTGQIDELKRLLEKQSKP